MSFRLDDFANMSKWVAITTGTAQILNRTNTSFQARINNAGERAWLVTSTPVDIRNIPLSILADLQAAGTFLFIGNTPPDAVGEGQFDGPGRTVEIRTKSAYVFLIYDGAGFEWAGPPPTPVPDSQQAELGFLVDASFIHAGWQAEELNSIMGRGLPMPATLWYGFVPQSCYVAIGALGTEHSVVAIGTSTFTAAGAVIPPLSIGITPTSASLIAGQAQTFHANVSGGNAPVVTWYEQGSSTPLGTGTDINISFQAAGTFAIYAVATDPTAPNSPLQSNISTVTVTAQTYSLTITAGAGGTTNPAPGLHSEAAGTNVVVTAMPEVGYVFDHWATDENNNNSVSTNITVVMNSNHSILAVFAVITPTQFDLIIDSSPIAGVPITVTKS